MRVSDLPLFVSQSSSIRRILFPGQNPFPKSLEPSSECIYIFLRPLLLFQLPLVWRHTPTIGNSLHLVGALPLSTNTELSISAISKSHYFGTQLHPFSFWRPSSLKNCMYRRKIFNASLFSGRFCKLTSAAWSAICCCIARSKQQTQPLITNWALTQILAYRVILAGQSGAACPLQSSFGGRHAGKWFHTRPWIVEWYR